MHCTLRTAVRPALRDQRGHKVLLAHQVQLAHKVLLVQPARKAFRGTLHGQ